MIDISMFDKADVLAALYNASRPQGLGFLSFQSQPMTREEAKTILDNTPTLYFDYLKGRVMKVSLADKQFDPRLYDRDLGYGKAQCVIDQLLERLTSPK